MNPWMFAAILLLTVAAVIMVIFIKKVGLEEVKKRPATKHIIGFTLAGVVLFMILGSLQEANGADYQLKYLQYIEAEFAVDVPIVDYKSPQCQEDAIETRITSDGRITLNAIKYGYTELNLYYLHKSCAIGRDDEVYDGVGMSVGVRFDNPWF